MDYQEVLDELFRWRDRLHWTGQGIDVIRAIEERIENESGKANLEPLYFMLAQEHEAQGNHAAAEAIRLQDPVNEVYLWYEDVERTSVGIEAIHLLQKRIDSEPDAAKRRELKFMLAQEHKHEEDYAACEAIYLQLFETKPDDPIPLIKLAERKLYFERQPEAAMRIIDRAIEVAYGSGNFRRNALGVKARIALAMEDFEIVEGVLIRIMQLGFEYGNIDVGFRRDFFDRLPPGSIDPEVARQYDEHYREADPIHKRALGFGP
jgi:tetratricopeptide (TPR) repeat protein